MHFVQTLLVPVILHFKQFALQAIQLMSFVVVVAGGPMPKPGIHSEQLRVLPKRVSPGQARHPFFPHFKQDGSQIWNTTLKSLMPQLVVFDWMVMLRFVVLLCE